MDEHAIPVLLMEDEDSHIELIRRAFQDYHLKFELNTAGSLEQARRFLRQTTPSLVITDLCLPDGRGTDLLKDNHFEMRFPVILMTSHGDERVAVEAIKNGASDYIVKSDSTFEDMPRIAERVLREWQLKVDRKRMADELHRLNAELEVRVAARTAELSRLNSQLMQEVADRTRIEEQLRQITAELQRSNAELQQFAYIASHDLQEPLRMVSSYLEMISDRYQTLFDEKAVKWIAFALDGASRMKLMIQALLEYARVGSRARPFNPVDFNLVWDAVHADLQQGITESGAILTHGRLGTLRGDSVQLAQLLRNLIGNAIKYRTDRKPEIHFDMTRKEKHWLCSVRDNGIGIESQYAERIFILFQRLHTRDEYPGTGIGLAMCRKIVERHGGRIWVESVPGEGSTFFFTLPDTAEPESAAPPTSNHS